MDFLTILEYALTIAITIFLCITIYYFMNGIKTKNYENAKKYASIYIVLNFIRLIAENTIFK